MSKRLLIVWMMMFSFMLPQGNVYAAGHGFAVIDADSGRYLFGTNPHAQLPIASLTKIWTAYVVIKNSDLQEQVVISEEASKVEGSSIYLEAGETASVETLLYGLMLRSGNDAAYALAEHVGGSIEGFVQLMNEEAMWNGLTDTHFMNPSGLHHELHVSSAYDTARMLQIAMKNKEFRKIASAHTFQGNTLNGGSWINKHKLIHSNENVVAGKTGYTKVAGRTLATYFEKENKACVVVTLNEGNDWEVHEAAANQVWKKYSSVKVSDKGTYHVSKGVDVMLQQPIRLLLNNRERQDVRHVLHIPRSRGAEAKAVWSVFVGNARVFSTEVTLK